MEQLPCDFQGVFCCCSLELSALTDALHMMEVDLFWNSDFLSRCSQVSRSKTLLALQNTHWLTSLQNGFGFFLLNISGNIRKISICSLKPLCFWSVYLRGGNKTSKLIRVVCSYPLTFINFIKWYWCPCWCCTGGSSHRNQYYLQTYSLAK